MRLNFLLLFLLLTFQFCDKNEGNKYKNKVQHHNLTNDNKSNKKGNQTQNSKNSINIYYDSNTIGYTKNYITHAIKGNIVSHSIMGLAWKILSEKFANGNDLELDSSLTNRYTNILNNQKNKTYINGKYVYFNSGTKESNIIDEINFELKRKFPKRTLPFLDNNLLKHPSDILAYAYFFLEVEFKEKFQSREIEFNNELVKGIYSKGYFHSLKILEDSRFDDTEDKNPNFLIKLITKNTDFIIVAGMGDKYNDPDKLAYVIKSMKKNELHGKDLENGSIFHMPQLDFHLKKLSYNPLIGQFFINQQLSKYMISTMYDQIKFKLNEEGVKVEIESIIGETMSAAPSFKKSLNYIFDKPFSIGIFDSKSKDLVFYLKNNNTNFMIKS